MIIHSMTATFGKLEHETLTLQPGLNIIEAPNEWGKSTWCAFLTAMLYGLETRTKSTKTSLADKERYAPWSGSPMAGRMDLTWNGRKITIERKTKGRIPLGQFAAYETESGLPVPELTAANCGQLLLGVERSVFLRAGFIRLNDMPVTQDEALRARLNALVTTGDESGDAERLGKALRDLKNRCRYNKTGLLPQAENERAALEDKIGELENLEIQSGRLSQRREEVNAWVEALENHRAHLCYHAAQADEEKVAAARQQRHDAVARLEEADRVCQLLPPREETEQMYRKAVELRECHLALQMEAQMLPPMPEKPDIPAVVWGTDPVAAAAEDLRNYEQLEKHRQKTRLAWVLYSILTAVLVVPAVLSMNQVLLILAGAWTVLGFFGTLAWYLTKYRRISREMEGICNCYPGKKPEEWAYVAREMADRMEAYTREKEAAEWTWEDYSRREDGLLRETHAFTQGENLSECVQNWQSAVEAWNTYGDAHREAIRADGYWQTLRSMAKIAEAPVQPDALTYSEAETARLLSDANGELLQLNSRLNQYQGRMESLGDREAMLRELKKIHTRIRRLEDVYGALTIAQQTLADASMELQRRFAPKIAKRAQELMSAFTSGRYNRLNLGEDLGLRAGAGEEDTLHEALWRSDGTVDQLYLALRLAVAEALTESAPLVLDDALVRFDDTRLKATLDVLGNEANNKQVILFTCQSREKRLCQSN